MQTSSTAGRRLHRMLPWIRQAAKDGLYHGKTLLLFTINDFKTMIFPSTVFALGTALYGTPAGDRSEQFLQLLSRLSWTLTWLWINLLAFTVANQKSSRGIEEDKLNKPWRPIPAKRLTRQDAEDMAKFTYPVSMLTSSLLGGLAPCGLLTIFGSLYNDLGWDEQWLLRNLLNAGGFTSFAAGALEVMTQRGLRTLEQRWLIVIAAVVCTTVHVQDMYDQVGDAAAGRRTIPLIIGDGPARFTIAIGMCFWSIFCPWFWNASNNCFVLTMTLGLVVASRSICKRSVDQDRTTFKIYNVWLMSLYLLPALQ